MNWFIKICQMSVQDIRSYLSSNNRAYFRYVRLENDEFRFSSGLDQYAPDHKALADNNPVKSAAYIYIYPDGFYVDEYSSSLQTGPAADDEVRLSELLGLPIMDKPFGLVG